MSAPSRASSPLLNQSVNIVAISNILLRSILELFQCWHPSKKTAESFPAVRIKAWVKTFNTIIQQRFQYLQTQKLKLSSSQAPYISPFFHFDFAENVKGCCKGFCCSVLMHGSSTQLNPMLVLLAAWNFPFCDEQRRIALPETLLCFNSRRAAWFLNKTVKNLVVRFSKWFSLILC